MKLKNLKRSQWGLIILIIFYGVGVAGMLSSSTLYFASLSPWILLLSLLLLFWCQDHGRKQFLILLALAWIIGYAAEVIGVHTGLLFGEYRYGNSLGLQLREVPLIIGVNWFLLTMGAGYLSNYMVRSRVLRIISGALLMVLTDLFIEEVAPALEYWFWQGEIVPLQNYLAWFAIGLVLQSLFQAFMKSKTNGLALPYYMVVTVFFIILYLFL